MNTSSMRSLSKAITAGSAFFLFAAMALASFGPARAGITHPTRSASPSFNNYTDSFAFYYPDERSFVVASNNDFSQKGNVLNVNTNSSQTIVLHAYMNNTSNTAATGVKMSSNSFHLNNLGQYVTNPFTTTQDVTLSITGDNTVPASVWDTATITSANGAPLRLRYVPGSTNMWLYLMSNINGNFYAFVDESVQNDMFGAGVDVGDRNQPLSGNFVGGDDQIGTDTRVEFQYRVVAEIARADLAVTKSANKYSVGVGETVTYTLNYSNSGPIEATGVTIVDDYDQSRMSINNGSLPAGCSNNGSVVTCTISGELANGGSGSLSYSANATAIGTASNTATISSSMADANAANNTSTVNVTINATPIAAGDIVVNELAWAGSAVSAADEWIELRNTTASAINLTGFQLTQRSSGVENFMLTIPSGNIPANGFYLISNYAAISASSTLAVTPNLVTTSVNLSNTELQVKLYNGTFNNGATLIDTAGNNSTPLAGSNGTPKASMSRNSPAGNGTIASSWYTSDFGTGFDTGAMELGTPGVSNTGPFADLSVSKNANTNSVNIGQTVAFTVNYNNAGPSAASGVVVTDDYDQTRMTISNLNGNCNNNGDTIVCTVGTLANGGSGSFTYTGTATASGTATNTVLITSTTSDPAPANNTASVNVNIGASADLSLTKLADKSSAIVGEMVTYTLNYSNAGPNSAAPVTIVDDYDQTRLNLNTNSLPAGCSSNGNTITCTVASLANGGNGSISYNGLASALGTATNTAVISSSGSSDPAPANNTAFVNVTIATGSADLAITKNANVNSVVRGNSVVYTVNYQNNGPTAALNVRILDDYDDENLSVSGFPGQCIDEVTVSGKRLNCNFGTLASGGSGSFTYTANTAAAVRGDVRNIASISSSSSTADPNAANNTATFALKILKAPVAGDFIVSEIMWMGSSVGANDQWFELRNATSFYMDVSGFQTTHLVSSVETLLATVPASTVLNPYQHYLVSRFGVGASSSLNVTPDQIVGSLVLETTNLQLKVYNGPFASSTLLDTADDGAGAPLAGSNGTPKASMARMWNVGNGTVSASWMTSILGETSGFTLAATDRGTPGVGNFTKLIVASNKNGGTTVNLHNQFGEQITLFSAFKATTADGVNLSTGDFDHDGSVEIGMSKNSGGNQVIQDEFEGSRLLVGTRDYIPVNSNSNGLNIAGCDFDGTGFKDYLAFGKKTGGNQVIIYKTDGTFVRQFTGFTVGSGVTIACGDFTGDGKDEIVVGKESGGNEVVQYTATGTRIRFWTAFSTGSGVNVATGDIDGDGRAEVIVGKKTGGQEVVLFEENGTYIRYFSAWTPSGTGTRVSALDFDGDGQAEIITARETGDARLQLFKANGTYLKIINGVTGADGMNVSGGKFLIN